MSETKRKRGKDGGAEEGRKKRGRGMRQGKGRWADQEAGTGHWPAWVHGAPPALLSWTLQTHMTQSPQLQRQLHSSATQASVVSCCSRSCQAKRLESNYTAASDSLADALIEQSDILTSTGKSNCCKRSQILARSQEAAFNNIYQTGCKIAVCVHMHLHTCFSTSLARLQSLYAHMSLHMTSQTLLRALGLML